MGVIHAQHHAALHDLYDLLHINSKSQIGNLSVISNYDPCVRYQSEAPLGLYVITVPSYINVPFLVGTSVYIHVLNKCTL